MGNVIPPNLVRPIVREWLVANEHILAQVLNGIGEQLAPIAAELAEAAIAKAFRRDSRDMVIDALVKHLERVVKAIDWLEDHDSIMYLEYSVEQAMEQLKKEILAGLEFVASFRANHAQDIAHEQTAPSGKGGAA